MLKKNRKIRRTKLLTTSNDFLITVVMVVKNNKEIIAQTIKETTRVLAKTYKHYELLIIDNGSIDGSIEAIKHLQAKIPNIRLIILSRSYNFEGHIEYFLF